MLRRKFEGQSNRKGLTPSHFEVVVEDVDGARLCPVRPSKSGHPRPYASVLYYKGMARREHAGRIGTGAFQKGISRGAIARYGVAR